MEGSYLRLIDFCITQLRTVPQDLVELVGDVSEIEMGGDDKEIVQ